MANQKKKLKTIIGVIKDMLSITKATLSTKRNNTKLHVAILRATSHTLPSPPSDHRIAAVLALGEESRQASSACINALMHRLHGTKNVYVAMNCLFTLHAIITKGSFSLQDQFSFLYHSFGGRNLLNLSEFRDKSDTDTWGLSLWTRWFGSVIEHNLMVSRFLGHYLNDNVSKEKLTVLSNFDLLSDTRVLVDFVEVVSDAPLDNSIHFQSNDMIYELLRLIGRDLRLIQQEIFVRMGEIDKRTENLSFSQLTRLLSELDRFESCREKLRLLFVNRNRFDALWELVNEIKVKSLEMVRAIEERRSLVIMEDETGLTELSPSNRSVTEFEHWVRFDSEEGKQESRSLVTLAGTNELSELTQFSEPVTELDHWVKFDEKEKVSLVIMEDVHNPSVWTQFIEPVPELKHWVRFDSGDELLGHGSFPLIVSSMV